MKINLQTTSIIKELHACWMIKAHSEIEKKKELYLDLNKEEFQNTFIETP